MVTGIEIATATLVWNKCLDDCSGVLLSRFRCRGNLDFWTGRLSPGCPKGVLLGSEGT